MIRALPPFAVAATGAVAALLISLAAVVSLLTAPAAQAQTTREQVIAEKSKVRLDGFVCDQSAPGWEDLPERFRDLVQRSLRLQARVSILDGEIYRRREQTIAKPNTMTENSVKAQQSLLRTAFGNN